MKRMSCFMWVCTLLLSTLFFRTAYSNEKDNNQLHGRILGLIEVPVTLANKINTDRVKLSKQFPALKEFYQKQKLEILPGNMLGEITNPLEKLTVKIGDKVTVTDGNGEFFFEDLPDLSSESAIEVEVSFANKLIERKSVTLLTDNELEDVIIRRALENLSMGARIKGKAAAKSMIPCLDNNGVLAGKFFYSDCYASLFLGPPWYNWMCWTEAMNIDHDHHGNVWCDGSHSCSLFVHGWDWNKQTDGHKHKKSWRPKW